MTLRYRLRDSRKHFDRPFFLHFPWLVLLIAATWGESRWTWLYVVAGALSAISKACACAISGLTPKDVFAVTASFATATALPIVAECGTVIDWGDPGQAAIVFATAAACYTAIWMYVSRIFNDRMPARWRLRSEPSTADSTPSPNTI